MIRNECCWIGFTRQRLVFSTTKAEPLPILSHSFLARYEGQEIQIDYKGIAIKAGALPDFYIYNNNVLYYDKGKLYYGTTK